MINYALLLALVSANPQTTLPASEPAQAVIAAMTCTPFKWAAIGEHQRGAILVPVTLGGRTYEFQLDTGADMSFIPEQAAVEAGLMKAGAGGARIEDVQLGGTPIGPRWLLTRGSVGTVGLDMLVGYTTVIDYPAQRFCVTPTADLPYPIYKRTAWKDAILRHGKLFVPVEIGGKQRDGFFFDTGASLFPLSTDLAEWKSLTGRDAAAADNRRVSGNAWGDQVELIGAPSLQPIGIGALPAATIEVFHRAGNSGRFSEYPFPAAGLIGNAALWNHSVVLTLGSRPQFGVIGPSTP